MELMLLTAGASDKTWIGRKSDRPLRTKGKRQAQKIGAWMGRQGLKPDLVLSAENERSKVSAQKALKAGGWTADKILHSADVSAGRLPALTGTNRVLLVAPKKAVRQLLNALGVEAALSAGEVVLVSKKGQSIVLSARVVAGELPDLFPFPAPNGPELRERPAYYYTQSAVIPYRRTKSGTQILMVRSSSGRHWVLPKGIVDPGLSPSASAQVEAHEEAGVSGVVEPQPLGCFQYVKWGAVCDVTVFAMEVTAILSEAEWEERHRTRKWVSPGVAAAFLHQPAFRDLIGKI